MHTQPQPYNSMIPALIETRHGLQHGMTMEEAKELIARNEGNPEHDWLDALNYGSAYYILGFDAEALAMTERSLLLNPTAAAYINLAVIHGQAGRLHDATLAAQQAYLAEPENKSAATIYSEALLRAGKWDDGWPLFHNYYDSRRVSMFAYAMPEWNGQPLNGKRLLVIEGGGFGDNIFFARWLRRLKSQGAHITYLCPATLCPLMAEQPYIDRVIPTQKGSADQIDVRGFDYFTPLLALGYKLHAAATDPWEGTYMRVPRTPHEKRRIGFCWQAAEANLPRPFRSLNESQQVQITSLLRAKGYEVESLVPKDHEINLGWDATARLMGTCDRIITVDTGVAHLAGAMELPTWVLLPGFSAWYYGTGYVASALYPSMRLFRNHVRGIDHAVNACCRALEAPW